MARSLWKGPFCEINLDSQTKGLKQKQIWSRRSVILPHFVGHTFYIHNGKTFISCKIVESMIGFKLGQFASTRKKPVHKTKTKSRNKN